MRVLIADDHALFRDGLRSMLETHGIEVIGEARNGREAVDQTRQLGPDIVLMDLDIPELDGLAATRLISAQRPDVKVVMLTASEEDTHMFEAIKGGAQGYLFKNLASDELFRLLDGVARGEPALTPALARKLLGEFAHPAPAAPARRTAVEGIDAPTEREREVLDLLVQCMTSIRELAERLVITENTVKISLPQHPGQTARSEPRSDRRLCRAPRHSRTTRLETKSSPEVRACSNRWAGTIPLSKGLPVCQSTLNLNMGHPAGASSGSLGHWGDTLPRRRTHS